MRCTYVFSTCNCNQCRIQQSLHRNKPTNHQVHFFRLLGRWGPEYIHSYTLSRFSYSQTKMTTSVGKTTNSKNLNKNECSFRVQSLIKLARTVAALIGVWLQWGHFPLTFWTPTDWLLVSISSWRDPSIEIIYNNNQLNVEKFVGRSVFSNCREIVWIRLTWLLYGKGVPAIARMMVTMMRVVAPEGQNSGRRRWWTLGAFW